MSIKAKAPEEDPETRARREAAEKRADAGRIEATQDQLSEETRSVIRQFGRLAAFSGQRSLGASGIRGGGIVGSAVRGTASIGGARGGGFGGRAGLERSLVSRF